MSPLTLVTSTGPGEATIAGMARAVVLPVRGPQMSTAMSSQDWRSAIPVPSWWAISTPAWSGPMSLTSARLGRSRRAESCTPLGLS